ncbi:MAG: hypothetical protein K0R57_1520 [Paenibacillaceae bacterium]|nr:hypothetical protein [Paenibacillaceae bacterium]
MLKDLNFYFDDFVGKRTEEIGQVILINNLYYKQLIDEKGCSFKALMKNIPNSYQALLFEFEDKANYQAAFANEFMYRQGLLDGLNLRHISLNSHEKEFFEGDFK